MKTAIGIDPDLHTTAVAVVQRVDEGFFVLESAVIVRIDRMFGGLVAVKQMCSELHLFFSTCGLQTDFAIVEGQQQYRGRTKSPQDITYLAQVAGACLAGVNAVTEHVILVNPPQWKGQVPKQIHQARTYAKMGWGAEARGGLRTGYSIPRLAGVTPRGIQSTDWKHLGDAVGLALWGLEQP